ncbi:ATP-binding protein [Streptomyces cynarae]|uniref:ATP-binding protein n=1 Tax=Streptomyces cynarae TaxID=2981134 RepID=A0ABY6E7B0_9ACTN|nr:ATP-binding protein [Streptomyces cynarae]UXY22555.1 ATP-binding protein [Streptomyces cynarae]
MAPPSLPQSVGRLPAGAAQPRTGVFDLPAVPAAVGLARTSVRRLLGRWGTGDCTTDNAVLVTSELVTNAVKHSAGDRIVCRILTDGHRLRIEVEDENRGGTLPTRRRPGPDDQGGRGLMLVGMLSGDWGVRDAPDGSGRIVWADLAPEPGETVASDPPPLQHPLRPDPHPAAQAEGARRC